MGLESCAEKLCAWGPRGLPLYSFGLLCGYSALVYLLTGSQGQCRDTNNPGFQRTWLVWLEANYITLPAQGADMSLNMGN